MVNPERLKQGYVYHIVYTDKDVTVCVSRDNSVFVSPVTRTTELEALNAVEDRIAVSELDAMNGLTCL